MEYIAAAFKKNACNEYLRKINFKWKKKKQK